jgi:hypothetical protein
MTKPLAIDLFCGLGGWAEGFLAEGYDVIGFDIERHEYGEHRYPAQLVIQDVLMLHGSQFRSADLIVASPPCQAYSYRAMPWKRAKALPPPDNTLFEACFRIQREACEAAARHIPLIVENVRGAQKWVGRARWNFGSYYLWGDVPALMPPTLRAQKFNHDGTAHGQGSWFAIADSMNRGAQKVVPGFRFDGSGWSFQSASVEGLKGVGPKWDSEKGSGAYGMKRWTNPAEGTKNGNDWFGAGDDCSLQRRAWSGSPSRKFASAMIAKIPLPLALHIARIFKPVVATDASVEKAGNTHGSH